jgi:hypothetical protein
VLPFEIAGLSLTIALIGSIVIAREDDVLDGTALEATTDGSAGATTVATTGATSGARLAAEIPVALAEEEGGLA